VLFVMWACTLAPWAAAADKEVKAKDQPKAKAEKTKACHLEAERPRRICRDGG
jgi:hypothetical protein